MRSQAVRVDFPATIQVKMNHIILSSAADVLYSCQVYIESTTSILKLNFRRLT